MIRKTEVDVEKLIKIVYAKFNCNIAYFNKLKEEPYIRAKQMIVYYLKDNGYMVSEIAKVTGYERTGIYHAINKFNEHYLVEKKYIYDYEDICFKMEFNISSSS